MKNTIINPGDGALKSPWRKRLAAPLTNGGVAAIDVPTRPATETVAKINTKTQP